MQDAYHPDTATASIPQLSPEHVLRRSREWVSPWYPPTARHLIVGDHELCIEDGSATLMSYRGVTPTLGSLAGALKVAAGNDAKTLRVTLGAEPCVDPPRLPELAGYPNARHVEKFDVLAYDLLNGLDALQARVPTSVHVETVGTLVQFADYERTSADAWGYPEPTDEAIRTGFQKLTPGWFVAYIDGIAVGTSGYTLVGDVARLWGAAVVPAARGRGAYRGLVAARLTEAAERGATMALTHARSTSSPILRRLGFHKFGEQQTYELRTH